MPSDKLTRVLLAKSPFSREQIGQLSEAEGWSWVYANSSPKREKVPVICFTGFSTSEKARLSAVAESAHMHVTHAVTQSLSFLCTGDNAGPAKLAKAKA